ncbi:MAG: hypothetical protein JSS34_06265 [Proteobacteria bacterium]|nr:hypothetical protein [Pseudomonadota bacterium]
MKIKTMLKISSFAFLGTLSAFTSFINVSANVEMDAIKFSVKTFGVKDTIAGLQEFSKVGGASKINLAVKTGTDVDEAIHGKVGKVVETIGAYKNVAISPDRIDDAVTALKTVEQSGALSDAKVGAQIIAANKGTVEQVAKTLENQGSTVQTLVSTGSNDINGVVNTLSGLGFSL